MLDCIFCKLSNGEIPAAKLYEDEEFSVILDAGPATRGHCLILPKAHYPNLLEMPPELVGAAFQLAQKIAGRMQRATGCAGINIVQNNGECAGQTVFHFHIHVIPRYEDGEKIVAWTPGELSEETREELIAAFQRTK